MTRKRLPLPIALFVIVALLAGCGGGAGSSSSPGGVNPSVPSIVQLLAVQQIVQTNSSTSMRAKVLDGNGVPIAGVPVVFTNLSLLGVLSSTTATTNSLGYATVSLYSTDAGFATVQAEVNTGSGKVRDRKMVFFSLFDLSFPTATAVPTLTLAVDNNSDGIYNDPTDFYLSSGEAIVRATVKDETGSPVLGDAVTFGSDSTELTFPDGAVKTTNPDGQAFARVKVVPSEIRNFDTPVNVTAVSAATGAGNVITLFLTPIEVGNIVVFANPVTVPSGGTSTVTANVTTTVGSAVPDGTAVNFSVSGGGTIVPFGQTTAGVATVAYTAPTLTAGSLPVTVTIKADAGGAPSGTTQVTVTPPAQALTVIPGARTVVSQASEQTITFGITGGTPSYTTISSDPTRVYNNTVNNGSWSGSTITAKVAANACPGNVTLTVYDSTGASKTVTVTIVGGTPFSVAPLSVVCTTGVCTPSLVTVTGGLLPYTIASSDVVLVPTPTPPVASGGTFTVTSGIPAAATPVTITVGDHCGQTASVAVTVNP